MPTGARHPRVEPQAGHSQRRSKPERTSSEHHFSAWGTKKHGDDVYDAAYAAGVNLDPAAL
jgi:hypothetical protein